MRTGLGHTLRQLLVAGFVTLAVAAPRLAEACSVCMSGREDENQLAFILTTIFLTVTPLGLVGGAILYVRSYIRRAEQAAEERDSVRQPTQTAGASRWDAPVRSH